MSKRAALAVLRTNYTGTMRHVLIDTDLGPLLIVASTQAVVRTTYASEDPGPQLQQLRERLGKPIPGLIEADSAGGLHPAAQCAEEILQYLEGQRKTFSVPMSMELVSGDFRLACLHALQDQVPWGTTVTYSELAELAGNSRAFRAAASACANNPLPILIPCHRVVARGGLGGYSPTLRHKRKLLELEGVKR